MERSDAEVRKVHFFSEELVPRKAENLNIGVMTSQFTVQLFTVSQKFLFLFLLNNILLY